MLCIVLNSFYPWQMEGHHGLIQPGFHSMVKNYFFFLFPFAQSRGCLLCIEYNPAWSFLVVSCVSEDKPGGKQAWHQQLCAAVKPVKCILGIPHIMGRSLRTLQPLSGFRMTVCSVWKFKRSLSTRPREEFSWIFCGCSLTSDEWLVLCMHSRLVSSSLIK